MKPTSIFLLASRRSSLLAACVLTGLGNASAASFTAGDLAVLQAAASANNTTFSLVEVSPTSTTPSTPVQTIAIDGTTLPGALRFSGSASTTGYLSNSQDGSLLVFAGHNSTSTAVNANTLTARGVGTFNPAGTFSLATTYTGASGNQARSATTLNNSTWIIADQGGFYTNGTSAPSPVGNFRGVKTFGGKVYVAQASSSASVIQVSTLSAPTAGTIVALPGLINNVAMQDFQLISSGDNGSSFDVLYVISATSNTVGTLAKYSLVSGTWVANGSYATSFGGFGLAAADSGNGAHLFVSTGLGALAANSLVDLTDAAGYNAAIAVTTANNVTRYTAPAGAIIKGVAFAPVAASQPDLSVTATAPAGATAGANFDYTITVTNSGNASATGVAVDFVLPAGLTFVSAAGTAGFSGVNDAGTVRFTGGTVAASATLTVTVSTNTAATYTAAAGAAVVDPANAIVESNEANNASAAATSTVVNPQVAIAPQITSQPVSVSISSGAYTTLTLAASGSPIPTVQWYQGVSGNTGTPVGSNSVSFTTPALTATTRYWARVSNAGGGVDTDTVTVSLGTTPTTVDLSRYVRIGRYDLPEPTRTALPAGTPLSNLLCQEASGVAYNWDSGTLFIIGDGGRSVTQVSKTGQLVDTMTLDLQAGAPQGTAFYDPEGITYVGNGQFVFTEERDRQLVKFTYAAGTTLTRAASQTVDLGTFVNNIGIEGLSYDPQTGGFVCVKEISPQGVFQTGVDFTAGTATNGSPTTTDSVDLFDPALAGFLDLADVFALSNLPYLGGQPQSGNLLLLSQASARIVNIDRSGSIASSLQIAADPGSPLSVADQQHEGLAMDRDGILYVVNENGGGDIDHPQLWVYAPSAVPNQAPSAVALNNALSSIVENTPTVAPIKVADLVVTDDGLGTNSLSLTGTDAAFFEITGSSLYLKAGSVLDYETKSSYAVTVQVDDTTLGSAPDASANFALAITDIVDETPVAPSVFISEVHPTGSSNTSYLADWFEVTNAGTTAVNISGWQMDDNSNGTGKLTLRGVTSIPAGKSAIFFEGLADGSTDTAKIAAFSTAWFGTSTPPAGFLIGAYGGSGAGLSSTGDAVNLFAADGNRITGVAFGAAVLGITFDNHAALGSSSLPLPTISTSSVAGVHGAFLSANATETGSPGTTGKLLITEVAPWSSGSSVAADWFELTNTGATAVDLSGWKMDDNSESPVAAVALNGITRVAPGESVIFVETATPLTTLPAFLSNWFGANPPAGIQVGSYTGSGVGLSGSGDAVNLYDGISTTPQANVSFGASPTGPFATFDNTAGLNFASLSTLSAVGVQGAFHAVNSASQIGSPGPQFTPAAGSFSAWLAARGYTSTGIDTDSDGDGLTDRVEFFFNLSPNRPAGFGNLPAVVMNGANRELHFRRLASVVGTNGTLRCSSDLQGVWPAAVLGVDYEVIREIIVGEETEVAYRLLGNESRKFFRFAIE